MLPAKATGTSFTLHILLVCCPFTQFSPLTDGLWSGYMMPNSKRNYGEKERRGLILRHLLH